MLPPFLPLTPRLIEVVVVLTETVTAAGAGIGAAAVVEGLGRLRLLLLGKAGGALCIDLLLRCNFPRQRIPERGDLLRKFTVVVCRCSFLLASYTLFGILSENMLGQYKNCVYIAPDFASGIRSICHTHDTV